MWGAMQLSVHAEYKLEDETDVCDRWQCAAYSNYPVGNNQWCYVDPHRWSYWNADGTATEINNCLPVRKCQGTLRGCWTVRRFERCSKVNYQQFIRSV